MEIHSNFPQPLFPVERSALREVGFDGVPGERIDSSAKRKTVGRNHLLQIASEIASPGDFDWILFADADCVAIRNIDHLFSGDSDTLYLPAAGGPDPGFLAVRGPRLHDFVTALRDCGGLTTQGLAALHAMDGWKAQKFERGEVLQAADPDNSLSDLANAAVIHFSGLGEHEKHRLAFAFHMMSIYHDNDGLFFDILDA